MLLLIGSDILRLVFAYCSVVDDLNAIVCSCSKLQSEVLNFKSYEVKMKVAEYFDDGRQPATTQELLRWFDILFNEYVILTGGETNPRRNILYRPTGGTFRRLCAIGVKRTSDYEAIFHHGKNYVLSGADSIALGSVESYDILKNVWSEEPSVPGSLTALACATHQGELYLSGGQDRHSGRRSVLIYRLTDGSRWDMMQIQLQRGRSHHASIFYQNKLWMAGGFLENSMQTTVTVECVDINSHVNTMSCMLRKRCRPRLYVINEQLYVVGGDVDFNETTIERYDLNAQSWELCCIFPIQRSGCASAVVGSRIYVFGGGRDNSPSSLSYDYFDVVHRWGSHLHCTRESYLPYTSGFCEKLNGALAVTLKF